MPTATLADRTVPNNLEAERALLGSILIDNSALNVPWSLFPRTTSSSEAHRLIFERMIQLSEKPSRH